jgi:hypothetical protein
VRGQEFWGVASPSDAYHLPKSFLKSFSYLGDLVMILGRCSCKSAVFCAVLPWTVCVCFTDSPRLADNPRGVTDHSVDRLDGSGVFGWKHFLYCGRPDPIFQTLRPLPGGQFVAARWIVRSVCRNLPSLIGSFASFLVIPCVLRGIIPRTCS